MIRWLAVSALTAALLGTTPVKAATTVVSVVLDHRYSPQRNQVVYYSENVFTGAPFNPGDTIDATLTQPGGAVFDLGFLPSKVTVTVGNGGGGYTDTVYTSTATLGFINPIGAVRTSAGPQTSVALRNPAVDFTDVREQHRGPLMFDGLHIVIHLDSSVLPFYPSEPLPFNRAESFAVGFTNDVPEPTVWAMLVVGFGLVGRMMRQRRMTPPV